MSASKEEIRPEACRVEVKDYLFPGGWQERNRAADRARWACEQLEEGRILFFGGVPFDFPEADREFLRSQKQGNSLLHKNISYRPLEDRIKGNASEDAAEGQRLHESMRNYSREVVRFLGELITPYAAHWKLDFASFRPQQEQGRDLPLHKRNDLLHVDSFPNRPTHGARILRCFTNINSTEPRVWLTTHALPRLADTFAVRAGLMDVAAQGPGNTALGRFLRACGIRGADRSAYDRFMLNFHDYMKESTDLQSEYPKVRLEFPPGSTWICFTDAVPHAVLSGRFALEQTFLVPLQAMVVPEQAPIRVLERIAGRPLARAMAV
jgi:hypothetical protein